VLQEWVEGTETNENRRAQGRVTMLAAIHVVGGHACGSGVVSLDGEGGRVETKGCCVFGRAPVASLRANDVWLVTLAEQRLDYWNTCLIVQTIFTVKKFMVCIHTDIQ